MTNSTGNKEVIAGIDIGTTKITCVIGYPTEAGFDIVGVGTAPSTGVRHGVVVNIEATTESVKKAREEAELMAGLKIEKAWVGVAGSHIQSFDSRGMVAIRNREVMEDDIERVIDAAKAVAVPADRDVIHVLPREYRLDDQEGICDPIGMAGVRLEALVHIVTGSRSILQNLAKCIEKSGTLLAGFVQQSIASSYSVLSEDEKNLGVAVVDMGGGGCDIVIYTEGSVAFSSSVAVGGQHFTYDVAVGLRTPQANAEELKRKYGCALASLVGAEESVDVDGVGGREARSVLRKTLCEVIEPRAEETLALIQEEIKKSGLTAKLGSGVVLTGGASQLQGLIEMSDFIFDVPVRRGIPLSVEGLGDVARSPIYSTAIGLIIHGIKIEKRAYVSATKGSEWRGFMGSFTQKIREMLGGSF